MIHVTTTGKDIWDISNNKKIRSGGIEMSWKNISLELADDWIEALEKYAKDNGYRDAEDVARSAIIVFLKERNYLK